MRCAARRLWLALIKSQVQWCNSMRTCQACSCPFDCCGAASTPLPSRMLPCPPLRLAAFHRKRRRSVLTSLDQLSGRCPPFGPCGAIPCCKFSPRQACAGSGNASADFGRDSRNYVAVLEVAPSAPAVAVLDGVSRAFTRATTNTAQSRQCQSIHRLSVEFSKEHA